MIFLEYVGSRASLSAKKQIEGSNLFEFFYLFFFARKLAAARGWISQSLSLRKIPQKHLFLRDFLFFCVCQFNFLVI